jgi:hypothetical protein
MQCSLQYKFALSILTNFCILNFNLESVTIINIETFIFTAAFQLLAVDIMKNTVFWVVTSHRTLIVYPLSWPIYV